jgi:hypothetical protein
MLLYISLAVGFYIVARMLDLYTRTPEPPLLVRVFAVVTAVVAVLAVVGVIRTSVEIADIFLQ